MDQGTVQIRQACEVETFERFTGTECGTAQPHGEFRLIAARHFVVDQEGKKLRVRELRFNGLTISRLQRIEDAGEAQLLEIGGKFRDGIHDKSFTLK